MLYVKQEQWDKYKPKDFGELIKIIEIFRLFFYHKKRQDRYDPAVSCSHWYCYRLNDWMASDASSLESSLICDPAITFVFIGDIYLN